GVDEAYAHRSMDGFGAFILGRNMFGPIRGPWPDQSWKGWWGANPPYHAPTFVLTHHPRDPIEMEGGTSVRVEDDRWLRAGRQRVRCARADPALPGDCRRRQFVFEATGIIEYLEARFPETARLIPSDLPLAAEVRMWDRFFDNYVSYPQGRLVFMAIGREPDDGKGGAAWKSMLETSYALLDSRMAGRTW